MIKGIAVDDGCRLDSTTGLVHHVDGDSKTFVLSARVRSLRFLVELMVPYFVCNRSQHPKHYALSVLGAVIYVLEASVTGS